MPEQRSYAVVITAAPGARVLDDAARHTVAACLAPAPVIDNRWLAEGDAFEILFAADDAIARIPAMAPIKAAIARALGPRPVDINIIDDDLAHRRKKLLVADMDSTIIQQECIDEIADVIGLKPKIAAITERAMRGELQFEDALRERLGLLKGIGTADLERVYRERVTLMPGAKTLIATMRKHGAYTALVSGGFTFFTSRVRAATGFDVDHSNTLGLLDGKLTGEVAGPILGKEAKLATLEHYRASRGLVPADTLAAGDGANDLMMIKAAGLGVAFRAKPIVSAEAAASITHGDLTALLYLQGYRREEFV
jgi:phosphoserine phosphatase